MIIGLGGMLFIEIVLILCYCILGGRRLSQFLRLELFNLALVNDISYKYLQRIIKLDVFFEVRDDVVKGKVAASLALWYPEVFTLFQLIVPFILLLIMAWEMNRGDLGKQPTDAAPTPKQRGRYSFPKWYIVIANIVVILSLMTIVFANMMILAMFISKTLLVCVMWDMWERIRTNKSMEPMLLVSWAEMLLFIALGLKGIVECVG